MVSRKPASSLQPAIFRRQSIVAVLVGLFASLGVATRNLVQPIVATITGPLTIPTGAVAGGFYMMWPVIAAGFTRKTGTATAISLVQAVFSLLLPIGNFGLFTFIIYLAPGLAIDGLFLLARYNTSRPVCMIAAAIANVTGTISVGALIMSLPTATLLFFGLLAAISGCVGGFIANMVVVKTSKIFSQNEQRPIGWKKISKIAIAAFIILLAVFVPAYYLTHQNSGTEGIVEGSIQIRGNVAHPQKLTYSQIEDFAPVTVNVKVSSLNPNENGSFTYTGVPLNAVLNQARVSQNARSVYILASDGFSVTISLQEAQQDNTILAYQKNGEALTPFLPTGRGEGPIRLVIGQDSTLSRWVKEVAIIEVQ